ncbi:MAG: pre-peptidase C-terminal domain-containing protein, partial [Planctomycetales bacterium]|nr:pre-peptidase C-terminal domain-containing protein [Planctomycetales bacterium]
MATAGAGEGELTASPPTNGSQGTLAVIDEEDGSDTTATASTTATQNSLVDSVNASGDPIRESRQFTIAQLVAAAGNSANGPTIEIGGTPNTGGPGRIFVTGSADASYDLDIAIEIFATRDGQLRHIGDARLARSGASAGTFRFTGAGRFVPGDQILVHAAPPDGSIGDVSQIYTVGQSDDSDGDGIVDVFEYAGNGGDSNRDGVSDWVQNKVATFPEAGRGRFVSIASASGTFENVRTSVQRDFSNLHRMPSGLIEFELTNIPPGSVQSIDVQLGSDNVSERLVKQNEETGRWEEFVFDGTTGAIRNAEGFTLYVQDGGRGDADGVANGTIVDPFGYDQPGMIVLGNSVSDPMDGWTVNEYGGTDVGKGYATSVGNELMVFEGDSFLTTISRTITIPQDPSLLLFGYELSFDPSSTQRINDAFEVALLDSEGYSAVPTIPYRAGDGRDSYFNVTETVGGLESDLATPTYENGNYLKGFVDLDISDFLPGEQYTLVMRLVNNDQDFDSWFRLRSDLLVPVAVDDKYSVEKDTTLTVTQGVLTDNDYDQQGAAVYVDTALVDPPSNGTLISINADGTFTYTPNAGFVGDDSFTYYATNLTYTSVTPATVTIHVYGFPVAPSGSDNVLEMNEDGVHAFAEADFPFQDQDLNDFVSVVISSLPDTNQGELRFDGVAIRSGDSFAVADINRLTFHPVTNLNGLGLGLGEFTFQVRDNGDVAFGGETLDATPNTISFDIHPVNDPPESDDATITIDEDSSYTFSSSDFEFVDAVEQDDALNLIVVDPALFGSGSLQHNTVDVTAGQSIPFSQLGQLVYTPDAQENGTPTRKFTFVVQDDGGIDRGGVDIDQTVRTFSINVRSINDAPSGANKVITIIEDQSYALTVSDFGFTDEHDDNSLRSVQIVSLPDPGHGVLKLGNVSVSANTTVDFADLGDLRFVPLLNLNGNNLGAFTFKVQDDGGTQFGGVDTDTTARTLQFNINPVNDPPAGQDNAFTLAEAGTHTFAAAQFGFTDPVESDTHQGVLITQLPPAGEGTLLLDSVAVDEGQLIAVADLPDLQFVAISGVTGADKGVFEFQVQDDGGTQYGGLDLDQTPNTIRFLIDAANVPPSGADGFRNIDEGETYDFLSSDFGFSDTDGDNFASVTLTTVPSATDGQLKLGTTVLTAGAVVSVAQISTLSFVPVGNRFGNELGSFTFQVTDDGTGQNTDPTPNAFYFNIAGVNDAPTGQDVIKETLEDTRFSFSSLMFTILDPADNDALYSIQIVNTPPTSEGRLYLGATELIGGETILAADINDLSFEPTADFYGNGLTGFDFRVRDDGGIANGGSDTAVATNNFRIDILPVNDEPSGADQSATILENTSYDFDLQTFGFVDSVESNALLGIAVFAPPDANEGVLLFEGNPVSPGQFIPVAQFDELVFQPATDLTGVDAASFKFQVVDDGGTENGGVNTDQSPNVYRFTVNNVNTPPAGKDAVRPLVEEGTYTFAATDFGFSDIDGDAFLEVIITTVPSAQEGELRLSGTAIADGQTVAVGQITSLVFHPAVNLYGDDKGSLTFQVRDDGGGSNGGIDTDQSPNTFAFNIENRNDPPVAQNDSFATDEDVAIDIAKTVVLANDSDPDGDLLTVSVVDQPAMGTLTQVGSGKWTYTPDPGWSGTDTFTYEAFDGSLPSNLATVTIVVAAQNDAPVANDDRFTTGFNQSITIKEFETNPALPNGIIDNDSDDDGDALTIDTITHDANASTMSGTLVDNSDGTYTFTPDQGEHGQYVFHYTISDGVTSSNSATVVIEILNPSAYAKFFVPNQSAPKDVFLYEEDGTLFGQWDYREKDVNNTKIRGATSNAAGTVLWTVTSGHDVILYEPDGDFIASWSARTTIAGKGKQSVNLNNAQGIALAGNDLWVVDNTGKLATLLKFTDGASIQSSGGSFAADEVFSLELGNRYPTGVTSDGEFLYVLDNNSPQGGSQGCADKAARVFVYDLAGEFQGSWRLDLAGTNIDVQGITTNPAGGKDLWVVARDTALVYHFPSGTDYGKKVFDENGYEIFTGEKTYPASSTFPLDPDNSEPYAIADPPGPNGPGDTLSAAKPVTLSPGSTVTESQTIGDGDYTTSDVDLFEIQLQYGQTLGLDTDTPTSDLDSYIRLFDDAGNQEAANDDEGYGPDSALTFSVNRSGSFFAGVSGHQNTSYDPTSAPSGVAGTQSTHTGAYDLNLTVDQPEAAGDIFDDALTITAGSTTAAEIGDHAFGASDVDLFKVNLQLNQDLIVDAVATSSVDTYLRIFDSQGTVLHTYSGGGTSTNAKLLINAIAAGDYYIGVSSEGNTSYDPTNAGTATNGSTQGTYNLVTTLLPAGSSDAIGDTTGDAHALTLTNAQTTSYSSEIGDMGSTGADTDMYEVDLIAGQSLEIDLFSANGALDGYIRLFDNADNELASNHDVGYGPNDSSLTFNVTSTGKHYIGVSGHANTSYNPATGTSDSLGDTGPYTLHVTATLPELPQDTIALAYALTPNPTQTYQASLGDNDYLGADVDMFSVYLTPDDTLDVTAAVINSSAADPYLRIFDGAGNELDSDNDSAGGFDATISFVPSTAGTYYVGVSVNPNSAYDPTTADSGTAGSAQGEYELTATVTTSGDAVGDTVAAAKPISLQNGTTVSYSSEIGDGTSGSIDVDMFRVTVAAGSSLVIDTVTSGSLDTFARLFDENGNELAYNDDEDGTTTDSLIQYSFSAAGNYYIGISGSPNGGYDAISNAGTIAGNVGLYDLNLTYTGPETPGDVLTEASELQIDVPYSATIGDNEILTADVDLFEVTLTASQLYRVSAIATSGGLDTYLRLFDQSGKEIFSDSDSTSSTDAVFSFTINQTGTYFIGVSAEENDFYNPAVYASGYSAPTSGDYTLSLVALSGTADLIGDTFSDSHTVLISPGTNATIDSVIGDGGTSGNDVDMFHLPLRAGQVVQVSGGIDSGSNNNYLRLFDADGIELMANDYDANGDLDGYLFFEVPEDADYYLGISGSPNSQYDPIDSSGDIFGTSGTYSIEILTSAVRAPDGPGDSTDSALVVELQPNETQQFDETIGDGLFLDEDADLYKVTLQAGQTLTVDINAPVGAFDSYVRLFNRNGAEIAKNDDGPTFGNDSLLTYVVTSDGDYYIGISDDSNRWYNPTVVGSGTAAITGTYSVLLTASEIRQADVPGDEIESAQKLYLTPTVTETIAETIGDGWYTNKDVDLYEIQLALGQQLDISVDRSDNTSFNGSIRLFDLNGEVEADNRGFSGDTMTSDLTYFVSDNIGSSHLNTFFIGISSGENGFYDATLPGSGAAGSSVDYLMDVTVSQPPTADIPGDTMSKALPVPLTATVTESRSDEIGNGLYVGYDVDFYEVELEYGQSLLVDIDTIAPSVFDSYVRVFDAEGTQLAANDNEVLYDPESGFETGSLPDSYLSVNIPHSGLFYVAVSGSGNFQFDPTKTKSGDPGSRGAYTVKLTASEIEQPGDVLENAWELSGAATETYSGEIGDHPLGGRDVDLFWIDVLEGDTLTIDAEGLGTPSFDTYLRLFDQDGQELLEDDNSGPGNDAKLEFVVPTDGIYYIGVSNRYNQNYDPAVAGSAGLAFAKGDYDLTVTRVEPVDTVGNVIGQETSADFTNSDLWWSDAAIGDGRTGLTDVDMFAATVSSGEELVVDISTNNSLLDSVVRIFDSSGNQVASNDDFGDSPDSRVVFPVTTTGTYYIGVSGTGNDQYNASTGASLVDSPSTGDYRIRISKQDPSPTATRVWISDSDGDWDDPNNWQGGVIPGAGDHVLIDRTNANPVVTIPDGVDAVAKSITSTEAIRLYFDLENDTVEPSLTITAASTFADFTLDGGSIDVGNFLTIGGTFTWKNGLLTGAGKTDVTGSTVLLLPSDPYYGLAELSQHTLLLSGPTTAQAGYLQVAGNSEIQNLDTFTFTGNATLTPDMDESINGYPMFADSRFTNFGTLESSGLGNGSVILQVHNYGTINVDANKSITLGDNSPVYHHAGQINVTNGDLYIVQDMGLSELPTTPLIATGGTINASGTIHGSVELSGDLQIDSTSRLLEINGHFTQNAGSTVTLDISGTVPGTSHDQLDVAGFVTLAGDLEIVGTHTYSLGDSFVLVDNDGTYYNESGTFQADVTGAFIDKAEGQPWSVNNNVVRLT